MRRELQTKEDQSKYDRFYTLTKQFIKKGHSERNAAAYAYEIVEGRLTLGDVK